MTSCSNDEFETNLPEEQKQYTKSELIEQALSRMPRTRVDASSVTMITIKDTVNIKIRAIESMKITWGDQSTPEIITAGQEGNYSHIYTDGKLSHAIYLSGSAKAIQSLNIDDNGLILLDVFSNENLETLSCMNNYLEELQLPNACQALQVLYVSNNELSVLEVAHFPLLAHLYAENNQLPDIDVSNNPDLFRLMLGNNKITDIHLLDNANLSVLNLSSNPIKELDLSKNTNLSNLDISFTFITDMDLRNNPNLTIVSLEGLSLETINNDLICDTSFSMFPRLFVLNVASTSFTSLDLSKNTMLYAIDISGSAITELDISGVKVHTLRATRSKLTNLTCTEAEFVRLYELRIEYTPFEKDSTNISALGLVLPDRNGVSPGHLYTYSRYINDLIDIANLRNWLINQ